MRQGKHLTETSQFRNAIQSILGPSQELPTNRTYTVICLPDRPLLSMSKLGLGHDAIDSSLSFT